MQTLNQPLHSLRYYGGPYNVTLLLAPFAPFHNLALVCRLSSLHHTLVKFTLRV